MPNPDDALTMQKARDACAPMCTCLQDGRLHDTVGLKCHLSTALTSSAQLSPTRIWHESAVCGPWVGSERPVKSAVVFVMGTVGRSLPDPHMSTRMWNATMGC